MINLKHWLFLVFGSLIFSSQIKAQDNVPCLIFFSDSENYQNLDVKEYNRIYFDKESFIISSSGEDVEDVALSYQEYNKIKYGIASPTISEVEELIHDANPYLIYSSDMKSLKYANPSNRISTVCVMSSDGRMVVKTNVSGDTTIDLNHLSPGLYIAFVYDKKEMGAIKFIR